MTRDEAWYFAEEWVAAWNAHDLDRIVAHYDETVVLTSPAAARLLNLEAGKVAGREAVCDYFRRGLNAFPELRFELQDVLWGVASIVLYYKNQRGTLTAEFMELSAEGKVTRVVANYSG